MKHICITLLIFMNTLMVMGQVPENSLYQASQITKDLKTRRVSSYDTSGANDDRKRDIKVGDKVTIMDVKGAGIINHIWITLAPEGAKASRNDIIIRMYWDGNPFPSVESPIGPFFGNGWNESYYMTSAPLSVTPAKGKSYVSYFAMPFSKGARIEIENQSNAKLSYFYYNIDYVEMPKLPANSGRFHAWFNHKVTNIPPGPGNKNDVLGKLGQNKTGADNYIVADIKGKGQFVGINYYVNNPSTIWYGEGDEMVFIDGEKVPSIIGTGTEDFFNTSWCPKEVYQQPYFGYPRVNNETGWLGRTHMYRFLIQDPIYFDKSCRFTFEHGHNNNLVLDLASVAYWYQDKAVALPKPLTKEERNPKPLIGALDIHLWRKAWGIAGGNSGMAWGNEN